MIKAFAMVDETAGETSMTTKENGGQEVLSITYSPLKKNPKPYGE